MVSCRLRFHTFLAPKLFPVYEFLARYLGHRLGCRTELAVGAFSAALLLSYSMNLASSSAGPPATASSGVSNAMAPPNEAGTDWN